uniref:RNase H type-1 domain-containing protein n=1 Tax=Trichogramma kaykai TaxID=54128 RepID=A0ABD2WZH3_9HYME
MFNFYNKFKNNPGYSPFAKHIIEFFNSNFPIFSADHFNLYTNSYTTAIQPFLVDLSFGTSIRSKSLPDQTLDKFVEKHGAIAIYTDGSRIADASFTGAACLCPSAGWQCIKSLPPTSSIFTAECIALSEAMNFALSHVNANFLIFCDSLSVLQSLSSPLISINSNHILFEIKAKHESFKIKNPYNFIKLVWIPSHIGITGNERVDALAKEGTGGPAGSNVFIPFTDTFELAKAQLYNSTLNKNLEDAPIKEKYYFDFMNSPLKTPWFNHKRLPRSIIVTINRMRSNHHSLAESLHRKNIIGSPECICGFEE